MEAFCVSFHRWSLPRPRLMSSRTSSRGHVRTCPAGRRAALFESSFLTGAPESHDALVELVNGVLELLREMPRQAYSGRSPAELNALLSCDLGAEEGLPADQILNRLRAVVA